MAVMQSWPHPAHPDCARAVPASSGAPQRSTARMPLRLPRLPSGDAVLSIPHNCRSQKAHRPRVLAMNGEWCRWLGRPGSAVNPA